MVLVCGLTRKWNRDNLMRPVLFHPQLGVGPKGLDRERMVEYSTLARRAVERKLTREMMAEELRLLYVAMTRAREKLILSLALTGGMKDLERLGEDLSVPAAPVALESQQSAGAWVLLHALTRPEAAPLRRLAGLPDIQAEDLGPEWEIRWVEGLSLAQPPEVGEGRLADLPGSEQEDAEALARRLSWQYPHQADTRIASKLTATQIKGRTLDQEAAEEAQRPAQTDGERRAVIRPRFLEEERGLTPAQRGTALHQAMQYLPLEGDHSPETVRRQVEELVAGGYLTRLQGEAAEPERLSAFFNSPLGREMAGAEVCRREFKFSLLIPAREYFPDGGEGEEVLLQGVVDAWFDGGGGVTVVDFKSDRVRPGGEGAKAEEYRPQLEAYSRALSAILGRPVRRRVLWFFATDTPVEL